MFRAHVNSLSLIQQGWTQRGSTVLLYLLVKLINLSFFSADSSRKQNEFMLNITRSKVIVTAFNFNFLL